MPVKSLDDSADDASIRSVIVAMFNEDVKALTTYIRDNPPAVTKIKFLNATNQFLSALDYTTLLAHAAYPEVETSKHRAPVLMPNMDEVMHIMDMLAYQTDRYAALAARNSMSFSGKEQIDGLIDNIHQKLYVVAEQLKANYGVEISQLGPSLRKVTNPTNSRGYGYGGD